MVRISIYFDDLKEEKQNEILAALGDDGNYDIIPIATLYSDDDEEFPMTIDDLIDSMKAMKIADEDYFGRSVQTQATYDKVNGHIDECIRLVQDFQSENSSQRNKIKIVKKLLQELFDEAPDAEILADIKRYDLVDMYEGIQGLLERIDRVEDNESKQEKLSIVIDVTRRIKVIDDWYPCVDGDKVDARLFVFYYPNEHGNYCVKLCVWGGDDTGVEQEFSFWDLPSALNKFDELEDFFYSIPDGVDRYWFIKHGFDHA